MEDKEIMMAQKKTVSSLKRITDKDEHDLQVKIGAPVHLASIDAAREVEEKLERQEYLEAMVINSRFIFPYFFLILIVFRKRVLII